MLSDEQLNKMAAAAAEIELLREKATPGPWVRDLERPRTILCVQRGLVGGVLYNTNGGPDADFIAASRSDTSAANCLRLVDEVRRLNAMLRQHAPKPTQYSEFFSPTYFQLSAGIHGYHNIAKPIIRACHIHGVPVPEHLKPYEENVNAD